MLTVANRIEAYRRVRSIVASVDDLTKNVATCDSGAGEFGTYFIGFARHLCVIEKMLERMLIGHPLDHAQPPPRLLNGPHGVQLFGAVGEHAGKQ